ncbi:DNA repair exonuclease [Methanoregula sp.]|uniref:metallophosphoesterase family protein n=1 Tax=Methanoregula sp. TaxID=2052170 RepID=UPI00261D0DEA|nr:DNA repair exonuclease [Methanoregula sp.]MDD5142406.1 DNA repair exonuclease [Methanoregula sp.]
MVRFLHTADWQMGMRAVHTGNKSKEIRLKRYVTAQKIVNIAQQKKVGFVLIAGDLFEHPDVDEVVVKKTVDILNQFAPIPVFILPGNHDPYIPGGIWDRTSWQRVGSHIHLLTVEEEIDLGSNVAIFPCPVKQKRSSLDPTSWIPKRAITDEKIRIGIAHGSLDSLPGEINFPISIKCADDKGLDYLALGDWHSFSQYGRSIYPGTFEPTSYDEPDSGNIVIVDIPAPQVSPNFEKLRCSTLTWAKFSLDIQDITDLEKFEEKLKALGSYSTLVIRINLRIHIQHDDRVFQQLKTLRDELDEMAFFLQWEQVEISVNPDLEAQLPEGLVQGVNEALTDILLGKIPQPPCNVFAGEDRAVVQKAKSMLRSFRRGGMK